MIRKKTFAPVIGIIITLLFSCLVKASDGLEFNLIGDRVVNLEIGEPYIEQGALAVSRTEDDVSSSVVLLGSVNTNIRGDYLLRYQISNNAVGTEELTRIVRVFDDTPAQQSQRVIASTTASMGYLEHLPENYGQKTKQKAPLIIFNHGSGASATGDLDDVECCGLPNILNSNNWDGTLPFVVLSPQANRNVPVDVDELDQFIEYAIETYDVDPQRIYMAGWSRGAYATVLYSVAYPDRLAAMVPTAGGFFRGIPSNVCDASDVPMWFFLGNQDSSSVINTGLSTTSAYRNCNPAPTEPVRLTRFRDADHFATSNFPFLPQQTFAIDASSDAIDQSIFDWLLSHGPQSAPDSGSQVDFFITPIPDNGAVIFGL